MIDIESELFSAIASHVRVKYPKIYVTGEYIKSPPSFPCVSIVEVDNQVLRSTRTNTCLENHVQVLYEVNVYSNKTNGKKSECKSILSSVDSKMQEIGFTRVFSNPIPNHDEIHIYRMVARYRAIVSKEKVIYRR